MASVLSYYDRDIKDSSMNSSAVLGPDDPVGVVLLVGRGRLEEAGARGEENAPAAGYEGPVLALGHQGARLLALGGVVGQDAEEADVVAVVVDALGGAGRGGAGLGLERGGLRAPGGKRVCEELGRWTLLMQV